MLHLFLLTGWKKLVRVDCFCGDTWAGAFPFWGDRNLFGLPLVTGSNGWNALLLPPGKKEKGWGNKVYTTLIHNTWRSVRLEWISMDCWKMEYEYFSVFSRECCSICGITIKAQSKNNKTHWTNRRLIVVQTISSYFILINVFIIVT